LPKSCSPADVHFRFFDEPPPKYPSIMRPSENSPVRNRGDNQRDTDYRAELERLLHEYEPGNEASAAQLLQTYAGLERELVECYRHYYAGKGSFRVALDESQEAAGSPRVSSPGPLHLPTSAIGTYLQAKLQARRSSNAKLEDVRGPTAADSPSRRHPAAVTPRRRATSFTARLQAGSFDEQEDELLVRRSS